MLNCKYWVVFLCLFLDDFGYFLYLCMWPKNYFENLCFIAEFNVIWQRLSIIIVSFTIFLFSYFMWPKCECNVYLRYGYVNDAMSFCSRWWYTTRSICGSMFCCDLVMLFRSIEWWNNLVIVYSKWLDLWNNVMLGH